MDTAEPQRQVAKAARMRGPAPLRRAVNIPAQQAKAGQENVPEKDMREDA
jgi:hypothetical protein